MQEIKLINTSIPKVCEVKYFVLAKPIHFDLHFAPSPPYVVENCYFDTSTEATLFKEECEKTHFGLNMKLKKKL